jgi:hypothetical protein
LDLSGNLGDSFEYSKRMVSDIGRWIALAILGVVPILNFVVLGYASRIISKTPESNEPPKLEGYADLWFSGLKILAACAIYMIIPIAIFAAGALASLGGLRYLGRLIFGLDRPDWAAWPMIGLAGISLLIGLIAAFLIAILAAMGIAHMIRTGKFAKAFAFDEIIRIIGRVGWGNYIIWLIAIFAISLIFSAIGGIPWVGWLMNLILMPPFMAFVSRSIGLVYASGAPRGGEGHQEIIHSI